MTRSEPLSDLERNVMVDALRDWFQFFQLIGVVEDATGAEGTELEERTLDLIDSLLRKGLMDVGMVYPEEGFVSWGVSPRETRQRIEAALRDLGRPPSLGDICWLAITAKGEQLARKVSNR